MALRRRRRVALQFGLVANPENRRAAFFRAALERSGLPPAVEVSWEQVLADASNLERLASCERIRVDSFGENPRVHDALIALGGAPGVCLEHGELAYLEEAHIGWLALLARLQQLGVDDQVWLSQPSHVATMFDKWQTHVLWAAAGLPRPACQLLPRTFEELTSVLPAKGRWFLKPLHGSSASGVCALRKANGRMQLTAPIELVREDGQVKLFNSLRIRSFGREDDIQAILGALLPSGMIEEDWLPKARLGDLELDLRVVVVAGEARHVVVRQSRHPMTNLHLGNQRGELSDFVAAFGEAALQSCLDLAEAALACFPSTLYAGVDVLFGRDRQPRLLEINAFGDLLPGVLHRGEDTATAIVRAALREPS
ncbi:MAG: STM4014 family protein [Polyangiaceae bacterium]